MNKKQLTEIKDSVKEGIFGRVANTSEGVETDSIEVLLKYVLAAKGGNHLEIGTLFGGSAIAVALAKEQAGQSGFVFCVDPLNGYYQDKYPRKDMVDEISGKAVTPLVLFENIDRFDIGGRVFVMKSKSSALAEMAGVEFSTAYIDGDHFKTAPLDDWNTIKDMVTDYVIFDNNERIYPDVMAACKVADEDPDWECVHKQGNVFVVKHG